MKYQDAITTVFSKRESKNENSGSIPQELLKIHPKEIILEMPNIYAEADKIQQAVLADIIFKANESVYGKKYNFSQIKSLAQWQKEVPLSEYTDYAELINDNLQGDNKQLFNDSVEVYVATSGSTGKIKYFLESAAGNAAKSLIMAVRGMYMASLLPVTVDMEAKNLTISNYASLGESKNGKIIVRASGQTARNMRQKTGNMNILPIEFLELSLPVEDRDYISAVYALAEVRLAKIFCNNLAHFERLYLRIMLQGKQMINDIRTGKLSVSLTEKHRTILADSFKADSSRAERLDEILELNGGKFTFDGDCLAQIWPNLKVVGCWLSASVGRDAYSVLRKLPANVQCIDLGYGASEGKLNIPTKLNTPSGAAAPFALFYEFLPLDGSRPLFMWEVKDQEHYILLITTYSGLYRYNLHDIVKIDGFIGKTPNIEFCCKDSEYIMQDGRKIFAYQLMDILKEGEHKSDSFCDLVQILQQDNGFSYVLQTDDVKNLDKLRRFVENECAEKLVCKPQNWFIMQEIYKNRLFDERTDAQRGVCAIKLPQVVDNLPPKYIKETL